MFKCSVINWQLKKNCCFLVHPTDSVRIDLKIPPDQYIYLRAATPAERQQWLVALGTAKACLTTMKHNGHSEMPGECEWIKLNTPPCIIKQFLFILYKMQYTKINYRQSPTTCTCITKLALSWSLTPSLIFRYGTCILNKYLFCLQV